MEKLATFYSAFGFHFVRHRLCAPVEFPNPCKNAGVFRLEMLTRKSALIEVPRFGKEAIARILDEHNAAPEQRKDTPP